jgi:hypothetical protein
VTSDAMFLDFPTGAAVLSLGHNHPEPVRVVTEQLNRLPTASTCRRPRRTRSPRRGCRCCHRRCVTGPSQPGSGSDFCPHSDCASCPGPHPTLRHQPLSVCTSAAQRECRSRRHGLPDPDRRHRRLLRAIVGLGRAGGPSGRPTPARGVELRRHVGGGSGSLRAVAERVVDTHPAGHGLVHGSVGHGQRHRRAQCDGVRHGDAPATASTRCCRWGKHLLCPRCTTWAFPQYCSPRRRRARRPSAARRPRRIHEAFRLGHTQSPGGPASASIG